MVAARIWIVLVPALLVVISVGLWLQLPGSAIWLLVAGVLVAYLVGVVLLTVTSEQRRVWSTENSSGKPTSLPSGSPKGALRVGRTLEPLRFKRSVMYPFERFTERAKHVLTLAQEEAERSHHSYIGTEHLLLGLLREGDGLAAKTLSNLGIEIGQVRETIESVLVRNERIIIQQIIPTSRVKKVIEVSFEEARRMGHNYVGTEHLLLGLLLEGEGIAAHVLQDLGASVEKVRVEVARLLLVEAEEPPRGSRGPVFTVGDRVLAHDPDPPYRLWEGRVTSVGESSCEIAVPGRARGEFVTADFAQMHSIPMKWTRDCSLCMFH